MWQTLWLHTFTAQNYWIPTLFLWWGSLLDLISKQTVLSGFLTSSWKLTLIKTNCLCYWTAIELPVRLYVADLTSQNHHNLTAAGPRRDCPLDWAYHVPVKMPPKASFHNLFQVKSLEGAANCSRKSNCNFLLDVSLCGWIYVINILLYCFLGMVALPSS